MLQICPRAADRQTLFIFYIEENLGPSRSRNTHSVCAANESKAPPARVPYRELVATRVQSAQRVGGRRIRAMRAMPCFSCDK